MDFERALEFASGQLTKEELKVEIDNNLDLSAGDSTRVSTETEETQLDRSTNDRQSSERDGSFLKFGWYQLFLVFLIGLGINSGSWIIFPLAYLELQPDFKCEFENSKLPQGSNTYWASCVADDFCNPGGRLDGLRVKQYKFDYSG